MASADIKRDANKPWRVRYANKAVYREMMDQPELIRAKFDRVVAMLGRTGISDLPYDYKKPVKGKIWEMRLWASNTTTRILYLLVVQRQVIILRVFTKKDRKTLRRHIEIAQQRAKEYANA